MASRSASIPTPSRADPHNTGGRLRRPLAAAEVEPGSELGRRPRGEVREIGFVDEEDVRPLEDARLHELDEIAGGGLGHEDEGLDEVRDAGLGLPDADRLDEDDVEGGGQHVEARAGDLREAAELLARRERAEEDARIPRRGAHAEAIAEQRAARLPARRVDGEDADRAAPAAQGRGERVEQGRLAGAGRAGQSDAPAARVALERIEQDGAPPPSAASAGRRPD